MTTWNPYKRSTALAEEIPAGAVTNPRTGTTRLGSGRAFSKQGDHYELNASSKKDLIDQVTYLIHNFAGENAGREKTATAQEVRAEHERILKEAFASRSAVPSVANEKLGAALADEIRETGDREGFGRNTMATIPVAKGVDARVRVRRKDITAFMATTDSQVIEQRIRQPYIYPPEFYLDTQIVIEDKEIEQSSADLLDEKFQDGVEAIVVREDRIIRQLYVRAASVFNTPTFFATLNPAVFSSLRTQVGRWGQPAVNCLLAYDLWDDIIADGGFSAWFDPVSKHELILEGKLGSLLNVNLITDGFRYPTLQVLQAGEIFMLAAPNGVGAITERKPLESAAINLYAQGRPARGWFLEQIEGIVVGNARGVAYGTK